MSNRILGLKSLFVAFMLLLGLSLSAAAQSAEVNQAFEQGLTAFERGQYERALFEYRSALNWPGDHQARARFNIGVCQHRLGRTREAIAEYRAAIRLRQENYAAASYALGVALQGLRQHREARAAFTQAVEVSDSKHAEALFELGLYAQAEHDFNAAADFYHRSLKQLKNNLPAAHNNLGVIMASYGQLEEAQREFEIALNQSRGKFGDARDNLARCRERLSAKSGTLIADLKMNSVDFGPRRSLNAD